jgi:imidazolonepropionase-like amidohydrolase
VARSPLEGGVARVVVAEVEHRSPLPLHQGTALRRIARRVAALLVPLIAAFMLGGCGGSRPVAPSGESILIWDGTLFDGTGSDPVPDGAVLVENGRIAAAGPLAHISVPTGVTRVDARGGTILPGVIDAHVHISTELLAGNDSLTAWLASGVTTLQDMGVPDGKTATIRDLLASVPARPPRVQLAGPMITSVGGYPIGRPYAFIGHAVANADEARGTVEDLIDRQGVSLIKVAVESGFDADYDEPGWTVLSPEEIRAITDEAHKRGKLVAAHVTGPNELRVAMEAGVDIASHAPITPTPDDVLREAANRGMIMISTVQCWMADEQRHAAMAAVNAARFHQLGGRLAIGTDYPFVPNSMPLAEFDWLSKAGMSSRDLIYAATHDSAAAIGRSADLGTLEPGKIADLIVVRGDPIKDWHAMSDVRLVMLDGALVRGGGAGTEVGTRSP